MKLIKYSISILLVLSITTLAKSEPIKMAKANWDTGYFQAEIYETNENNFVVLTSILFLYF